jgi:DMSO/TMAO reductase YedYZ molybdopterin-dependent catalytic subunit
MASNSVTSPLNLTTISRRAFVIGATALAAAPALGLLSSDPARADEFRPSVRQPGTLSPLITPNDGFYTTTKNAAGDPVISPAQWRLVIDGAIGQAVQLDYATLQQLPTVEVAKTLECVSNLVSQCGLAPFGCELIGTAVWRGVALADIIQAAGGPTGAGGVTLIGADEYTSTISLEAASDPETLLVYEMNGEPLPARHGAPARVIVPGRYGYKSAKWVVGIRLTPRIDADWYGQRGWSRDGIVKTMSRIDVPAQNWVIPAGTQTVQGIAYAGARGISLVEFSADGGATWQPAQFVEGAIGRDAWVRWQGSFQIAPGQTVNLVSRATDGAGALQGREFRPAQPDGAEGWHTVDVRGA